MQNVTDNTGLSVGCFLITIIKSYLTDEIIKRKYFKYIGARKTYDFY